MAELSPDKRRVATSEDLLNLTLPKLQELYDAAFTPSHAARFYCQAGGCAEQCENCAQEAPAYVASTTPQKPAATPRTDAWEREIPADSHDFHEITVAWARCRQIERELAEATRDLESGFMQGAYARLKNLQNAESALSAIAPIDTIASLRRKGWNAAVDRAADLAEHYAKLMNSQAAQRAADEIRALKSNAADGGKETNG